MKTHAWLAIFALALAACVRHKDLGHDGGVDPDGGHVASPPPIDTLPGPPSDGPPRLESQGSNLDVDASTGIFERVYVALISVVSPIPSDE